MNTQNYLNNLYRSTDLDKREVDVVLCHLLKINSAGLYVFNREITGEEKIDIQNFIDKRLQGVPFSYLSGLKEFWDLELIVNQDTLIPRPETELIVEWILSHTIKAFNGKILDLGTGTGAIALSIGKHRGNADITAVDFSNGCLKVARENKSKYKIENVTLIKSNWFENVNTKNFNYIVSNPPYIDETDKHLKELKYEPVTALTAKAKGLADIKKIIAESTEYLVEGGWLLIEHGYNQKHEVQEFFKQNCYKNVKTIIDLAQLPRITIGQWQNVAIKSQ